MKKIVDYVLCIIAIIIGGIVFLQFDVEGLLWNKNEVPTVSMNEIDANSIADYIGKPAGEGVQEITNIKDWEGVLNNIDYVTVKPISIQRTNVYSLADWEAYFNTRKNGTTGRRRAEVTKSALDWDLRYIPYYIIELPDHSRILAQMNRHMAKDIEKGKDVILPLGQKQGFLQEAKNLLKPICDEQGVSTDYVLYTIDNEWHDENSNRIFLIKFATAIGTAFLSAIILMTISDNTIFRGMKKDFKD